MTVHPPIVLTTDFGQSDSYVGVMKGVISSINPRASVIDLTHLVQPQNVQQAAFILGTSHNFFPKDSIHVVVVDPGVGTDRKAVLLVTPTARFLAPDNGVLSYVVAEHCDPGLEAAGVVPVPLQCAAYRLTNPDYWLHPVSNTFHGRDLFAPAAAHLSLGVRPGLMGELLSELVWRPPPKPTSEGNRITGEVIYADHFGNLITNIRQSNIRQSLLGGPARVTVEITGHRIDGLSRTFHDNSESTSVGPLALLGSNGYLEIAIPDGSAQELLGVRAGETVLVILDPPF
ncbi:MAG TPA: SAM-dependent chlorinase/fluorinase [Dehalococcoidia bacterium]|nr:SAM-dependent chlorinase/fluorinase [Dehalococcoidia bacterium]